MPHVSTSKVQHSALKTFFWFVQFHFLCELHVISVPDTKKELFVFLRANHLRATANFRSKMFAYLRGLVRGDIISLPST